eukprot:154338-Amphidinium_carterae.1
MRLMLLGAVAGCCWFAVAVGCRWIATVVVVTAVRLPLLYLFGCCCCCWQMLLLVVATVGGLYFVWVGLFPERSLKHVDQFSVHVGLFPFCVGLFPEVYVSSHMCFQYYVVGLFSKRVFDEGRSGACDALKLWKVANHETGLYPEFVGL